MKMILSGVYKIQSKIKPDRVYIGSAVDIKQRWCVHLSRLKNNKHHSIKLQRHYNKYGKDDLLFLVLILCEKKCLIPINGEIPIEQYFMDVYKPYFNVCPKAGSSLGCKQPLSHRLSVSKRFLGVPFTQEHKDKLSKRVFQYTLDGIFIKEYCSTKITETYGFDPSAVSKCCLFKNTDHKRYLWTHDPLLIPQMVINASNRVNRPRPIRQISIGNVFIKEWDSIRMASKAGFDCGKISECCRGKRRTHSGFKWEYSGN